MGPEPREPAEGQGNRPGLALSRRASPPRPPRLSPALTSTEKGALVRGTTGTNVWCYSLEIAVKKSCIQMSQESNIVTLKCQASCWVCMSSGHSLRSQPQGHHRPQPKQAGPCVQKSPVSYVPPETAAQSLPLLQDTPVQSPSWWKASVAANY